MIFPILRGLLSPVLTPITFLLFSLNILVFVSTLEIYEEADKKLDAILGDHTFMDTQGAAFSRMIEREPAKFSSTLRQLAVKSLEGDRESRRALGNLAIRNVNFMSRAEGYDFGGDEVAMAAWRKSFLELKEVQAVHPTYLWGLSRLKNDWIQYVSYQFSHSGLFHLFWNMIFLLIFGGFVETRLGGSFVILSYLGGGLLGALSFSTLSGISSSPLVGASAAVSALIALVGVTWLGREKLRFFYWLLPAEGYFGFAMLPSWLVLLVTLLPDVSGYIGASSDFGSVAYSAHLGGAAFGALMALAFRAGWLELDIDPETELDEFFDDTDEVPSKRRSRDDDSDHDDFRKTG